MRVSFSTTQLNIIGNATASKGSPGILLSKQYILIKEYPSSPNLNQIVTLYSTDLDYEPKHYWSASKHNESSGNFWLKKEVEDNPEFWILISTTPETIKLMKAIT